MATGSKFVLTSNQLEEIASVVGADDLVQKTTFERLNITPYEDAAEVLFPHEFITDDLCVVLSECTDNVSTIYMVTLSESQGQAGVAFLELVGFFNTEAEAEIAIAASSVVKDLRELHKA